MNRVDSARTMRTTPTGGASVKRGEERWSEAHPAIEQVLAAAAPGPGLLAESERFAEQHTTSLSLARALAVGCLSRLDPGLTSVNVWDPAAGSGFAGSLLVNALRSAGVETHYRGQDIEEHAVVAARHRFNEDSTAEIAHVDTLSVDAFDEFPADLVIVDAPWGVNWRSDARNIEARHRQGEFQFGFPERSDATWLFISLALEKLRPAIAGGGRVAALVTPAALSSTGSAEVRRRILEAGLIESVTRLPEGLAPNTGIALYLLTFSNKTTDTGRGQAMVADLQTQFATDRRRRQVTVDGLRELESGLRTRKAGPRNRMVSNRQFVRRDAHLARATPDGVQLAWRVTTHGDTPIDDAFLTSRYGSDSDVGVAKEARVSVDLDPSPFFSRDAEKLLKGVKSIGWPTHRLSTLLTRAPDRAEQDSDLREGQVFVPTGTGAVTVDAPPPGVVVRVLAIDINQERLQSSFLAAWLNSAEGMVSRQLASDAGGSGNYIKTVRSDAASLMRWADELVIPVPEVATQIALSSADERLRSFQSELESHRAMIWSEPDSAAVVVGRFERAFDDSLDAWLEQLPFPIASALWTAETTSPAGEQQRAYVHAWEGIATFHATVLLSACRTDPGLSMEVETSIRQTLNENNLGIETATFKTWVVIAEKTARELRRLLHSGDADDVARIRRAFAGLGPTWIERLVSRDVIKKFNEVIRVRNHSLGHSGYVSEDERKRQVDDLVSDLRDLKAMFADVWTQLRLVRAGRVSRTREGYRQEAEVAIGTRSPFATETFAVGEPMIEDELYLVRDGSESPLLLGQFVQLRAAPSSAQFTTYFYNRTDGSRVRMVSYQHSAESEVFNEMSAFREQFGALASGDVSTK